MTFDVGHTLRFERFPTKAQQIPQSDTIVVMFLPQIVASTVEVLNEMVAALK